MNDKKICLQCIIPLVVAKICVDALIISNKDSADYSKITELKDKCFGYVIKQSNPKLLRRLSRCCNELFLLFTSKQDGTYYIRKMIVTVFNATQQLFDENLINEDVALMVQALLDVEHNSYKGTSEDWEKLLASANKKTNNFLKIIKNI